MPWQFFSSALSNGSQSVVGNANLISKIYFPRLIVPAGAVVTSLADLFISLWLLVGIMAWFHFWPSWHIIFLPFFIALAFFVAMGPGLLLTALTVKYRDFRYITPVLLQVGQIASPIGYSTAYILSKYPDWRNIYPLNPMVGVIDGFRSAVLGGQSPLDPRNLLISIATTAVFMVLGIWFFRRTEKSFADVI
jgi:lipopolysaccharide transport system permease protein